MSLRYCQTRVPNNPSVCPLEASLFAYAIARFIDRQLPGKRETTPRDLSARSSSFNILSNGQKIDPLLTVHGYQSSGRIIDRSATPSYRSWRSLIVFSGRSPTRNRTNGTAKSDRTNLFFESNWKVERMPDIKGIFFFSFFVFAARLNESSVCTDFFILFSYRIAIPLW